MGWEGGQLDEGWLESLYSQEDLTAGSKLPWPGNGKVTNWSVVVLDLKASEKLTEKQKDEGIRYCSARTKYQKSTPKNFHINIASILL